MERPSREFGSKSAVHRCCQKWLVSGVFENIMRDAGKLVEDQGKYRLFECFIDGTFSIALRCVDGIRCTKMGEVLKIMVLVDGMRAVCPSRLTKFRHPLANPL